MSKMLLVAIDIHEGTETYNIDWLLSHCTNPRLATAADIPDELIDPAKAAKALRVSVVDLKAAAKRYRRTTLTSARLLEAARRVREIP